MIPAIALLGTYLVVNNSDQKDSGIKKETPGLSTLEDYYKASLELGKPKAEPSVSFLAVGDIMLSRTVADKILKNNDPNYPFRKMSGLLGGTDFNFGNLESPISGENYYGKAGEVKFNAPVGVVDALKKHQFEILSLANNHMLDQGDTGLANTLSYLSKAGIQTVGAGTDIDSAWQPKIMEANGIKIGFIAVSYASSNDGGANDNGLVARTKDLARAKQEITRLKKIADFIVVSMHAGSEYTREPNNEQQKFARSVIDAGANLVIGSHPHWVQTIEKYQGKYIFYSLGNFIFDQEWSQDTKEGLAIKVTVNKSGPQSELQGNQTPVNLKQIELIPVIIEDYSTPRLANETEIKRILEKIGQTEKWLD